MALLKFKNGQRQNVSDTIGARIWLGKNGFIDMDDVQESFAEQIDEIILTDYMNAPDEYIRQNLQQLIPKVIRTWAVDPTGRPARPTDRAGYIFAEKWGLWSNGKPTALVIDPQQQLSLI